MKRNITKLVSTIMIIALAILMSSCSGVSAEEDNTDHSFQLSSLFAKSEYEKIYDTYAEKMEEAAKRIRKECLAAEKEITDKDELDMFISSKVSELTMICFEGETTMIDIDDESKHSDSEYEKWSEKLEEKKIDCLWDVALE